MKWNGRLKDGEKGGNHARVIGGALQVRVGGDGSGSGGGGNLLVYSTSEYLTGKTWIDGRPIYGKVLNFGALPNNSSKQFAHGITGMDRLTAFFFPIKTACGTHRQIPYTDHAANNDNVISWSMDATNLTVDTHIDWSTSTGFALLEYVKA